MMKAQKLLYESGNELAAYAAMQIEYHIMGYYPITPSTQIAEELDKMKAEGLHQTVMIAAEGEHSAAGICYGASTAGGRVFNATSANGLLYALEQLPVQSGTRFPMVLNVACRTVSGPLSIKGDHSDIMYTLNTGWLILFAATPQEVYDFNIIGLKLAEKVKLPVIVAFDGFFTSHQKRRCMVFENKGDVSAFLGQYHAPYSIVDMEHPVSIGSYMNEPDIINNKYQVHMAMEESRQAFLDICKEYGEISGRSYAPVEGYRTEDAEVILFLLGSSFHTAKMAVDHYREQGKRAGAVTLHSIRPFPKAALYEVVKGASAIVIGDRQDSYGAGGGNMTLEVQATLQANQSNMRVISRVYGLGGRDFYVHEAEELLALGYDKNSLPFDYLGKYTGKEDAEAIQYFAPLTKERTEKGITTVFLDAEDGKIKAKGGSVKETTLLPKRLAPGHGACPGCGIPVNVNLLLKGMEGNVVLLFQTGCGMVVTTAYPKTAFKTPYIHNLFQNGAATLTGVKQMYLERQRRGELPEGDITFVMVSGDGGMDIGMGSALGAALRNDGIVILEYDNGGYMNTGYQLSYSTPMGAKSSTSHVGKYQYGKTFFHKDTPQILAAAHVPYVATASESNPADFIKKGAKAQAYAKKHGFAYVKCLSACPLNWNDKPMHERDVIRQAVDCCYFPLYEVEHGVTTLNYDPEAAGKKADVASWLGMMGRTKHLVRDEHRAVVAAIQNEVDRRWKRLQIKANTEFL